MTALMPRHQVGNCGGGLFDIAFGTRAFPAEKCMLEFHSLNVTREI
jgi:hypothetical protein